MRSANPRPKVLLLFLAIFYLPGTVLHEASHFLFAKLLLVPVGNFNVFPKFSNGEFILGSVQIARTDIFRRFLVGIAPIIVGLTLLLVASYAFFFLHLSTLQYALIGYCILCLLNTMWLSKNDLYGAWKVFTILLIALGLFFVLH